MADGTKTKKPEKKTLQDKRVGKIRKKVQDAEMRGVSPYRARQRISVTNTRIIAGEEDLQLWDLEELLEGRKRGKDGHFRGRKPVFVPKAVHDELMRRTLTDVNEIIRSAAIPAAERLKKMVEEELAVHFDDEGRMYQEGLDGTQLRAVQEVLNRVLGKVKDNVEITATIRPWEQAIQGVHVVYDDSEIIDLNPVEDEDEAFEDEE